MRCFVTPDSPLPSTSKTLMAWVGTGLCHIMPLSQLTYTIMKFLVPVLSIHTYFLKLLVLLEVTQQSDKQFHLSNPETLDRQGFFPAGMAFPKLFWLWEQHSQEFGSSLIIRYTFCEHVSTLANSQFAVMQSLQCCTSTSSRSTMETWIYCRTLPYHRHCLHLNID